MPRAISPTLSKASRWLMLAAAAVAVSGSALAQYKWIGPDGQVNYGDRPPSQDAKKLMANGGEARVLAGSNSELPFAVRAAQAKSPVTFYAAANCNACDQARKLMSDRGIPFTERQIRTAADLEAFKQLGFADGTVPALTVGNQRSQGFEAGAWSALFDGAGYPKSARLPEGYKAPTPTHLASGKPALDGEAARQAAAQEKQARERQVADAQAQAKQRADRARDEQARDAAVAIASDPSRFRF